MVAKRTQHVAPNNVAICWVDMLRSFGRGLTCGAQQCWDMLCWHVAIVWPGLYAARSLRSFHSSNVKPQPNDRNMSRQHIATLLGATFCVRLARQCWDMLR